MCCCTKILNLCKVAVCGEAELDLHVTAQVEGEHELRLNYLGVQLSLKETFEADGAIKFPTAELNENYTYLGELFDPNGDKILIQKDGINYDCIQFETVLSYEL